MEANEIRNHKNCCKYKKGHAVVAQLVQALCYRAGRSRVRFQMAPLEFFLDISLPAEICSWGRLCLNHK